MPTQSAKKTGLSLCAVAAAAAVFAAAGPALTADDDPVPAPAPSAVAPELPKTPPVLVKAIRQNQVTVVAIHATNAIFDELALREARAGAAQASAKFMTIDTRKEKVISAWVKRYPQIVGSPTILVFGRGSEEPISNLTIYSDREVVAQAVTNARVRVIAAAQRKAKAKAKNAKKNKSKG